MLALKDEAAGLPPLVTRFFPAGEALEQWPGEARTRGHQEAKTTDQRLSLQWRAYRLRKGNRASLASFDRSWAG